MTTEEQTNVVSPELTEPVAEIIDNSNEPLVKELTETVEEPVKVETQTEPEVVEPSPTVAELQIEIEKYKNQQAIEENNRKALQRNLSSRDKRYAATDKRIESVEMAMKEFIRTQSALSANPDMAYEQQGTLLNNVADGMDQRQQDRDAEITKLTQEEHAAKYDNVVQEIANMLTDAKNKGIEVGTPDNNKAQTWALKMLSSNNFEEAKEIIEEDIKMREKNLPASITETNATDGQVTPTVENQVQKEADDGLFVQDTFGPKGGSPESMDLIARAASGSTVDMGKVGKALESLEGPLISK